jgi:hypothetical protein
MIKSPINDNIQQEVDGGVTSISTPEQDAAFSKKEELRRTLRILSNKLSRDENAKAYLDVLDQELREIEKFTLACEYIKADRQYFASKSLSNITEQGLREFEFEISRIIRLKLVKALINSSGEVEDREMIITNLIESMYGSSTKKKNESQDVESVLKKILEPYLQEVQELNKRIRRL